MNRRLRDRWVPVTLASVICGYVFVTSCRWALMLSAFPAPDPVPAPPPKFAEDTIAVLLLGLIFSVTRLFYPMALHAGQFEHGTYALVQLPLVLGVVAIATICAAASRKKSRSVAAIGILTYMAMMLVTNELAPSFRADHSNDFPIGNALHSLPWQDRPTEADVRRVAGVPLAEATFTSNDPALPAAIRENMAHWKRSEAFILAYFEEDQWNRMVTYYVMFDVPTRRRFSQVEINRLISNEYWPNNVPQPASHRAAVHN